MQQLSSQNEQLSILECGQIVIFHEHVIEIILKTSKKQTKILSIIMPNINSPRSSKLFFYCISHQEDVEHTLFECIRQAERRENYYKETGERFDMPNVGRKLLAKNKEYQSLCNVVRAIIETKENEDRQRHKSMTAKVASTTHKVM